MNVGTALTGVVTLPVSCSYTCSICADLILRAKRIERGYLPWPPLVNLSSVISAALELRDGGSCRYHVLTFILPRRFKTISRCEKLRLSVKKAAQGGPSPPAGRIASPSAVGPCLVFVTCTRSHHTFSATWTVSSFKLEQRPADRTHVSLFCLFLGGR